jgi:hypothetical protein
MAGDVAQLTVVVNPADLLYRGINPQYCQQGQLTSGVFVLKKKHSLEQGPSVGIEKLITLSGFQTRINSGWGVGALEASVPQDLTLIVQPLPDPKWEEHSHAHAVITDYQRLSDKARTDAERILRIALQKRILVTPTDQTAAT